MVLNKVLAGATFWEHLICFSAVKSITFLTLKLVHQVGGFTVSKGGDEVGQIGAMCNKWLDGDVDLACFAVGLVAREESFRGGKDIRADACVNEDLA